MQKYKILHIPSGKYLYSDEQNVAIFSKTEAKEWFSNVCNKSYEITWLPINKEIGNFVSREEFELIPIEKI